MKLMNNFESFWGESDSCVLKDEDFVLRLILHNPLNLYYVLNFIESGFLTLKINREIFTKVEEDFKNEIKIEPSRWYNSLSPMAYEKANLLYLQGSVVFDGDYATKILKNIQRRFLDRLSSMISYMWVVCPEKKYFNDIKKFRLLSPEEEIHLSKLASEGDSKAREILIQSNLRLVVNIALKYKDKGLPLMDLISEGNLGLIHAIDKFDYTKGNRLSTYATWWIRQSIKRAIAEQSRLIRLPVHMVERINKVECTRRELIHTLGREPTYEEIAKYTGILKDKVEKYLNLSSQPVSLTILSEQRADGRFKDYMVDEYLLSPEQEIMNLYYKEQIEKAMNTLTQREKRIIKLRAGLEGEYPHTLEEVGMIFGVTRERIRQIECRVKKKVRKAIEQLESTTEKK